MQNGNQHDYQLSRPKKSARVLFVDQTAQLGGAELWLKDVVLGRGGNDKVFLFQDGPLSQLLGEQDVEVVTRAASERLGGLKKESGLFVKLTSSFDVVRMVRAVASAAADCDVIYANTPKALVVSALAGLGTRKPVVYHLHDILSRDHFSSSNLRILVGLSNRLVRHVVANSQATLQAYRAAGGKCACSVSYNGFDPDSFLPPIERQTEYARQVRAELGLDPAAPLVAVFGRLAPWKGQQLAIRALHHLRGVHLMLVGDALFGEADYKLELQRLAQDPAVTGRVHFMGFRRDVFPLMQSANIVLHASIAPEPFGRVIVEAMLSRRPIIAARAGGAAEIVTHGVDGWLFTPGDEVALAECVHQVSTMQPASLATVIDNAQRSARERFSLQGAVNDVANVVERVTNRHHNPTR